MGWIISSPLRKNNRRSILCLDAIEVDKPGEELVSPRNNAVLHGIRAVAREFRSKNITTYYKLLTCLHAHYPACPRQVGYRQIDGYFGNPGSRSRLPLGRTNRSPDVAGHRGLGMQGTI